MGKYRASVDDHVILPAAVRLPPAQERFDRLRGQIIPAPISIRLLIDTGSKRTTLNPGLIAHLKAPAAGSAQIITALGTANTELFWVSLEFPEAGLAAFPEVLVARLPLPPRLAQFHGLLGRDLLRRFESFDYEGRRSRYTIRDKPGAFAWLRHWL